MGENQSLVSSAVARCRKVEGRPMDLVTKLRQEGAVNTEYRERFEG
jgi:hypothetical protein